MKAPCISCPEWIDLKTRSTYLLGAGGLSLSILVIAALLWWAGNVLFSFYLVVAWTIGLSLGLFSSSRTVLARIKYNAKGIYVEKLLGSKKFYDWGSVRRIKTEKRLGFTRWIFILDMHCTDGRRYRARVEPHLGKDILRFWKEAEHLRG